MGGRGATAAARPAIGPERDGDAMTQAPLPGAALPGAPLLDASGIARSYGAVAALRSASLSILPGEVHALMGANGAGKSTLVKILTGAVRPDRGTILLRGQPLAPRTPGEARRAGLVPVYQEPSLIPDLSVADNLRLTATPTGPFRDWVRILGLPGLDLRDLARDLPLATLRVLDLARALAVEPAILLLDEMTAALPADLAEHVLNAVRHQTATGRSVIFISHRLLEIASLCDRATVLRDGETVGVVPIAPGAEERIVDLMLGAPVERARAPHHAPAPPPPAPPASRSAASASAASSRTSRSRSATARSSPSSPSRARARTSSSPRSPAPPAPPRAPSRSMAARSASPTPPTPSAKASASSPATAPTAC